MAASAAPRLHHLHNRLLGAIGRGRIPAGALVVVLACIIGILAGYGAVLFTWMIHSVSHLTVENVMGRAVADSRWYWALGIVPVLGLLLVSWITRRFAPEAQGHGVPEVITAVARHDSVIRPRVAAIKILASGLCIGTGGSVGREGPIVQIGSTLGSVAGQMWKLSAGNIKVLVAAGAAAGISATFHAPMAGVIFASEIILGNFAVESLTPIVIASVLADVVQQNYGEHGVHSAFRDIHYSFEGAWEQLPTYMLLGLLAGLAAVGFTKLLYRVEDVTARWLPVWWLRALVLGGIVGTTGVLLMGEPPVLSHSAATRQAEQGFHLPPLFGVGYETVEHSLHLENKAKPAAEVTSRQAVFLDREGMLRELAWLLPLVLLKPLMTSLTLAGGGSGGIFAPSLFLGATLGAAFGLICNLAVPDWSADPGVYAIVGMGAVVAGTTHGVLSAILIVYELTDDYHIILPIMAAAGLSSLIARLIDSESIYHKKLSRRGELVARGHELHRLEDIHVRDVMVREFPTVKHTDNVAEIVRTARAHPEFESLPVMNDQGQLIGIIRPEDLHRVLDSDIPPYVLNGMDIAMTSRIAVSPDENLLEAMRDFGSRDVETLPVEQTIDGRSRLVGLLLRSEVMGRYREEMLRIR